MPTNDEMAEWSKAKVCKTFWGNPRVGSNPTLVSKHQICGVAVAHNILNVRVWVQLPAGLPTNNERGSSMNKKLEKLNIIKENTAVLGPWTIVEVVADSGIKGWGASHKSHLDKWNGDLGLGIAKGRAMKNLFNKVNKVKTGRNNCVFVG